MSDLNQIHTALERLFNDEGQRILFRNDPDREFLMTVPLLELDGVTTLRLDHVGALEARIRLEREEPNSRFLLYAPTEEADYEDDWLVDIRLYSRTFRADRASTLLQALGLVNLHLRIHVSGQRSVPPVGLTTDSTDNTDNKFTISQPSVSSVSSVVSEQPSVWPGGLTTDSTDNTDNKFSISVPSVSSVVKKRFTRKKAAIERRSPFSCLWCVSWFSNKEL